jgi:hypothetical protein
MGESVESKDDLKQMEVHRAAGRSEEEIAIIRSSQVCANLAKFHMLGLLPNIPKTGIKDIDEPVVEDNDPFSAFSKMNNLMNTFDEKKPEAFVNYFAREKV